MIKYKNIDSLKLAQCRDLVSTALSCIASYHKSLYSEEYVKMFRVWTFFYEEVKGGLR